MEEAARAEISPADFWENTPHENYIWINGRHRGRREKVEAQLETAALHAAWILQALGSEVTPDDLLGRKKAEEKQETTREDYEELARICEGVN